MYTKTCRYVSNLIWNRIHIAPAVIRCLRRSVNCLKSGWKATLRIAFTRNYFNMQIRKCEGELCFDVVGKDGYADVFFKLMSVRD